MRNSPTFSNHSHEILSRRTSLYHETRAIDRNTQAFKSLSLSDYTWTSPRRTFITDPFPTVRSHPNQTQNSSLQTRPIPAYAQAKLKYREKSNETVQIQFEIIKCSQLHEWSPRQIKYTQIHRILLEKITSITELQK